MISSITLAEVEETLKRIQSHKGVIGTMVVNAEGKYFSSCLLDTQNPAKNLFVVRSLTTDVLEF
uniref:Roadblock/LAMTOR2 domain-containing protein n=1 Tax=Sus scrofa TaxID=9823 RepID=A0A8D1HD91_PIG